MNTSLPCFKAYDIRGRIPDELNPTLAYRIGLAYAARFRPACMAIGHDVRLSSRGLVEALARGLQNGGAATLDLGLCGTEEAYWAAQQPGVDGAIEVTASHNPHDYNGMKLVRAGAIPLSGDSGLRELEADVGRSRATLPAGPVTMIPMSFRESYIEHLLGYVDVAALKPLRIVVNAGNGAAGPLLDQLERRLPLHLIKIHHQPDGSFPNGIPNPLLPAMRVSTSMAVQEHRADFGVAWDGDFDRCFLFDEQGRFIEGYYIVGLLAQALLRQKGPSRIVHDPRLTWNTIDIVRSNGGTPVLSKTGHAFIKERMRLEDAAYGGEMSAHHYFRDFGYCDNGMIPWLLVAGLVSAAGQPLSQLVRARIARFPASGELNFTVNDVPAVLQRIHDEYAAKAIAIDRTDGLSIEASEVRFNVRASNTEPLLRLNVETRGDEALMNATVAQLSRLIRAPAAVPVGIAPSAAA